jgi:DNA damage-inducible protein 1
MSSSTGGEITITLVVPTTGQSESLPLQATSTTVGDLLEWSQALFGLSSSSSNYQLVKDGKVLTTNPTLTLQQAGIHHGDMIAVVDPQQQRGRSRNNASATPVSSTTGTAASGGGLDFSSLLGAAAPTASSTGPAAAAGAGVPVYYPGMAFDEAMHYNPHPATLVQLLFTHDHLLKELNYHSPQLAQELMKHKNNMPQATVVWQQHLVKGGIQAALRQTQQYHTEQIMKDRLAKNPNDQEAKEYFENKNNQALIQQQYQDMMQEYPESMARVLMLYIRAKVNGHEVDCFVDSGAQTTIMSKKCARQCGILHLVDKRFAGIAVGVGTGKFLGRIHVVQLQINQHFFPCTITVMDDNEGLGDKNMDFLLGLDMLKRFSCNIDLEKGSLRFRLGPQEHMETPFLHEKDLDETKGGTLGFDAEKANQELLRQLQNAQQEKEQEKKGSSGSDDKDTPMG